MQLQANMWFLVYLYGTILAWQLTEGRKNTKSRPSHGNKNQRKAHQDAVDKKYSKQTQKKNKETDHLV